LRKRDLAPKVASWPDADVDREIANLMTSRNPTTEERGQERAFFLTLFADSTLVVGLVLVAMTSGSLSLLGETIRTAILLLLHFHAFWVLQATHRGRFAKYEFGVGKIEHLVWTLLGLAALIGAYWVSIRLAGTVLGDAKAASPLGLAFAAVANAVALTVNYCGLKAMERYATEDASGVLRAQISARQGMMLVSLALMPPMTAAALASDPVIAFAFDAVGAIAMIYLKLLRAVVMLREGVPGLLDAPAPAEMKARVMEIVRSIVPGHSFRGVRTRRCGTVTDVELLVDADCVGSGTDLTKMNDMVVRRLREDGIKARFALVVAGPIRG
jgi:divalent metal cation (Fe/Co/Zn/Cd) transporter